MLIDMLTYRAATPADLPFIVGLIVEDSVVATTEAIADAMNAEYRAALAAIDADPNQEMFVVDHDGVAVGCFQLSYLPGLMRRGMWRAQIESVRIARTLRGQGLGTTMMQWAIARARERGCGLHTAGLRR